MDERQVTAPRNADDGRPARGHLLRPCVTNVERDFWRRAVAAERRRQRCGQPAPFPFQPA